MKYVVGRPFDVADVDKGTARTVQPGDELTGGEVRGIPFLEAWTNNGYLYKVVDAKDYDFLPPHIFTQVMLRHEAEAKIVGDSGIQTEYSVVAQHLVNGDETAKVAQLQRDRDEAFADHRRDRLNPFKEDKDDKAPSEEEQAPADPDQAQATSEGTPADAKVEEPQGGTSDYNPADHTVEEVKAYLAEHPEETEAVVLKEIDGKGRRMIVALAD